MKYFCAECKTKHDTSDIAADMWSICANEIICVINRIKENMQVEELDDLNAQIPIVKAFNDAFHKNSFIDHGDGTDVQAVIATTHDELLRFLREPQLIGHKKMALPASKIRDRLVDSSLMGSVISGTYSLSLRELFKIFGDYLELTAANIAGNLEVVKSCKKYMEIVPSNLLDDKVYDKQLRFSLLPAEGGNNELYLDRVTDTNDDPRCLGDLEISNTIVRSDMVGFIRVCPHCGKRLSRAAGTAPEIVVALAGSPRAGKTSCMTAIASALWSGKYGPFGMNIAQTRNDPGWEALLNEIRLYQKGYAVTKTPIEQVSVPAYSLPINIMNQRRVLTFVDMPGEFWADREGAIDANFFSQYQGIYSNIDCIWFFISKFTVLRTELRKDANASEKLNETRAQLAENTADTSDLITAADYNNIEASFSQIRDGLRAMGKELPPVAVIVTKPDIAATEADRDDMLCTHYDFFPAPTLVKPKEENDNKRKDEVGENIGVDVGAKNLERVQRVLVRNRNDIVLNEIEFFKNSILAARYVLARNSNLFNAIQTACPRKTYMSIAAYGIPAKNRHDAASASDEQEKLPLYMSPNPYKEIFPLLWTLSICGYIKIRHWCKWRHYKWPAALRIIADEEETEEDIVADYRRPSTNTDRRIMEDDIASNLFPVSDRYKVSVIEHARNL